MQKFLLVILFFIVSSTGFAQTKATSHQVAKGETLYSISRMYHVTVSAIEKANDMDANPKLKIGQKLVIPASATKAGDTKADTPKAATKTIKPSKPESRPVQPDAKATHQTVAATSNTMEGSNVHTVEKGETVYAIARANGLTAKQIKDANHLGDDMKLKLGQKLVIPTKNQDAMYKPVPKEPKAEPKQEVKAAPVSTPAETGRDYLTASPPAVKKETTHIETPIATPPVQTPPAKHEIVEPAKPVIATPAPVEKTKTSVASDENPFVTPKSKSVPAETLKNEDLDPNDYPGVFGKYAESGKKKMVYRGIAMFMQSDNPGNQFLALYNYADMGSILKITNLMSKESIYVKVIGKVPTSDTQNDVILKVSGDAAKRLKVTEDKFLVEVTGFNAQ